MEASSTKNRDLSFFRRGSTWFSLWGIALIALGIAAIYASTLTTMVTVFLIGLVLFIGGVVVAIDTFTFWWSRWDGFLVHLLMAIIYLVAGFLLMKSPLLGSISITLFLGVMYIILGIFRIAYALSMRMLRWGWSLFNGVLTLLLGLLILANWPASSLFILGLFVGIDLLFLGWAYLMIGVAAKSIARAN